MFLEIYNDRDLTDFYKHKIRNKNRISFLHFADVGAVLSDKSNLIHQVHQ